MALVTNTLASFYIEENLKARERQATGTTEFLKAQLAETKKRLDEQERRVSEFKRRYLGELPQQMQANLATLEALNAQLRLNSDNQVRAVERRQALAGPARRGRLLRPQVLAAPGGARAGPGAAGASPRAAQAGADRGPRPLHRRAPDRDPAQGARSPPSSASWPGQARARRRRPPRRPRRRSRRAPTCSGCGRRSTPPRPSSRS